jgi:protein arginine N-methyltransferase 1
MPELNSDTMLQLAPSLTVQLGPEKVIHVGGRRINAPANILSILDAFSNPIQYSVAVKNLTAKVSGAQAWIELVSNIRGLHQAGVLVDEAGSAPTPMIGWAAPQVHIVMLNDKPRTDTFIAAINDTVREGDVVVDIGTGTGVLALASARAGAKHVYAIEATEIGQAAKELFEANGFADRITLIPGWSSQVQLPEKANVLVAEIIGNDPLEEGVMETFADARRRFLTPDARIIPSRVQSFGAPIEIDEAVYKRFAFTPESTLAWREWYGFDFASLLETGVNKSIVMRLMPHEIRSWPQLSDPVLLADLDLSGTTVPRVNETTSFTITKDGTMSGFIVYFNLDVSPGQQLSTAPEKAGEKCSWAVRGWLSGAPVQVKKGDRFNVRYSYRVESSDIKVEISPA